mgnify:CR=1 FL=1
MYNFQIFQKYTKIRNVTKHTRKTCQNFRAPPYFGKVKRQLLATYLSAFVDSRRTIHGATLFARLIENLSKHRRLKAGSGLLAAGNQADRVSFITRNVAV